jgi:hypothetical protein
MITEEFINQMIAVFARRAGTFNANIPEDDDTGKKAFLSYIIRFDGKGCRVFTLEELLLYFRQANEVERLLVTLETGESLRSGRKVGAVMELGFEKINNNGCFLTVTSDDKDWVDASFSAIQDILIKHKNKNGWVRTAWMQLLVQITGVAFGFFISLWAAVKIAPKITIQNSFVICFLFVLLIFSNTWSYLNKSIFNLLNYYFPNVKFYRPDKDRIDWLMQAIIGGIIVAIVLWGLNLAFSYVGNVLSNFVTP